MADVSILKHFEALPDPRVDRTKKYPLEEILLLMISAALSGCTGWKAIKDFGELKLEWLRKYLPYENGIPADDTLARVIRRLCPQVFKSCFFEWTQSISKKTKGDIIAIDGKTVCGSHDLDREQLPIHMVSAWSDANSVVLGQEKVPAKSNEITAIPNLLALLDIKDCIVTIDAMGTQKDIAQQICNKGGDYVLALKGNQGHLLEDTDMFVQDALQTEFLYVEHDYVKDVDYGHGRIETRECWAFRPNDYKKNFRTLSEWKNLETIAIVKATRETKNKRVTETRYYISSCACDAEFLMHASRKHWGIESMHWILDVTFREDASRIRKGDSPENMSILRHIAINTLKKYTSVKDSMPGKIQKAALSDNFREDILKKVLKISTN